MNLAKVTMTQYPLLFAKDYYFCETMGTKDNWDVRIHTDFFPFLSRRIRYTLENGCILRTISCHCFVSPHPLFSLQVKLPLQEFHSRLQRTSGSSKGRDLPCGELLERRENFIFCWTSQAHVVKCQVFPQTAGKTKPQKALLPYSFLSCTGNVSLFDHVVQNINSMSILDRFILSLNNIYAYFYSSHFPSH